MCGEKNFNEDRIRNGAKKLAKAKQGQTQGRLDSFFKVLPSSKSPASPAVKRKVFVSPVIYRHELYIYYCNYASQAEETKKGKGGGKFKRAK